VRDITANRIMAPATGGDIPPQGNVHHDRPDQRALSPRREHAPDGQQERRARERGALPDEWQQGVGAIASTTSGASR
jgi:hypothetical protein